LRVSYNQSRDRVSNTHSGPSERIARALRHAWFGIWTTALISLPLFAIASLFEFLM
jgi:hypothetical protein